MDVRVKLDIVLTPEPEGGYSARCPQLPGCFSSGDNEEEAFESMKEAIQGHLETMSAHNIPFTPLSLPVHVRQYTVNVGPADA